MMSIRTQYRMMIAKGFLEGIGDTDPMKTWRYLSPYVSYRVLGNHQLSGSFVGREEVIGHLAELANLTKATFDVIKWRDWLAGDSHIAAVVEVQIQRGAELYKERHMYLLEFSTDDQIETVVVYFDNERSATRFFGQTVFDEEPSVLSV
jgi:hypothetical protein